MRPRKSDRHLPPCLYFKHGAYHYVKRGKWKNLGPDLHAALVEYARLVAQPMGGMAKLIEDALPGIIKGKARQTQAQYKVAARRLQKILEDFAPQQVTPRDVAQIRRAFADTPAVANRTLVVLRQVFDYALEESIVDANPCVGIKMLPLPVRNRLILPAEYQAIREKAKPRLQLVMDLCYLTGQRIGDVLAIKRTDLREDGVYIEQEKTKARLVIAWTPELKAAVDAATAAHGPVASLYVVKGPEGRQMPYTTIWKDWRAACKLAKVADANIHDLRAMSGTDADAQGEDAQKLLGHTDAKMTKRYLRARSIPVVHGPSKAKKRG